MEHKFTCAFTGHRVVPESLDVICDLRKYLVLLIEQGVDTFINGGALGFDTLSALEVIRLKKEYDIKLNLILPCKDQDLKWNINQRETYSYILDNADSISYVCEKYEKGCMHERNRRMIDNCDILIAYCVRKRGGSYYSLSYALKNDKKVINLAKIGLNSLTNRG